MSARRNHVTIRSPLVMSGKKTETLLEICTSTTTIGNSISVHILEYLSIVKTLPTGFQDLAVEFLDTSHALFAARAGLTGAIRLETQLEDDTAKGLEVRLHQTKTAFLAYGQMVDKLLSSQKKHTFGKLGINIRKMFAEGDMERLKTSMTLSRTGLEAHPLPSSTPVGDAKLEAAQCIGYTALSAVLERPDPTQGRPLHALQTKQISAVLAGGGLPPPPPSPSGPLPLPPIRQDTQSSLHSPSSKSSPWSPVFSEGTFLYERSAFSEYTSGDGSRTQVGSDRPSAVTVRGDDVSDVSSIQSMGQGVRGSSFQFQDYGDRTTTTLKQQGISGGEMSLHHQQQQPAFRAKLDPSKAPNSVMPNGETPFTHAMNKSTPMSLVERMLLHGANPDLKNSHGETALFKAIACGRLDLVIRLCEAGADVNLPGPKILLWPAVHTPEILETLLKFGADLTRAPGVLELATSINSSSAVDILLRHNVDINAKKDGIYTPLCSAIRDDRGDLVEKLLHHGADPNQRALDYPLFEAISYHRTHLLPSLLAAGADPNIPKGIIECAVSHENQESLLFLLNHTTIDIDINARSPAGHTALTTAIRDGQLEFLDILLSHGADPGVRGQEWPISMAVPHPEILAKLLPHIPVGRIGKGVLEQAVVADSLASIKLLLAKGVDVEERNAGVFSPLTTAIRENRKEIFRFLVEEAGADVNSPGEHLPIVKAIRRHREEDLEYMEVLLRKGVDVNLVYRGWNAVLQALDLGDLKILRLLATRGKGMPPDLEARDESGRSVREILRERGLEEEERILLGNGGDGDDGMMVGNV